MHDDGSSPVIKNLNPKEPRAFSGLTKSSEKNERLGEKLCSEKKADSEENLTGRPTSAALGCDEALDYGNLGRISSLGDFFDSSPFDEDER
ncbi:hypothetical protein NM208_g8215 [Fusarium decemcellulare]|uniref:Uncharacterized protein n=1 Tax=Fusarium decemcellulare TaxID=57161 RepID=A0ACC1S6B9_9HYPO|nr:hypothetical protein NM208_g8215 [Fusarium decemcellulare]